MMTPLINKAILFLYEGETEGEFYQRILSNKVKFDKRKIRVSKSCLVGNFNINSKVANEIYNFQNYLKERGNIKSLKLYVVVALDREASKPANPPIDIERIKASLKSKQIKQIDLIIATQDIESWLLIDIDNIYKYLRTPISKRNIRKYSNHESFTHKDLSALFKLFGKEYKKGKKTEGLLDALDIDKIYNNCQDLRDGISSINALCE